MTQLQLPLPAPKTRNYPGKINFEDKHGCKAVTFRNEDEFNSFFETNNGCLVAGITPMDAGKFLVLYTIVLDDEELEVLRDRADVMDQMINEKRAARRKAEREELEAKEKIELETERLAMLGKKCEHDHGGVIEELRKLKKAKK